MGHTNRSGATRRASGLETIYESRWHKLRQQIKRIVQLERNIRAKGVATRGRFTVRNASPPKKNNSVMLNKNKPPGLYFVSQPYKRGRFKIENIYGFVPYPKKRTNAKSP
jgi:hypothetical protein